MAEIKWLRKIEIEIDPALPAPDLFEMLRKGGCQLGPEVQTVTLRKRPDGVWEMPK